MIKLADVDSEEFRISQALHKSAELFTLEAHGVIPPVAILATPYQYAFIVMPRYVISPLVKMASDSVLGGASSML